MAPTTTTSSATSVVDHIFKRARCNYWVGNTWVGCRRNRWDNWGRWVLAGIALAGLFIFVLALLCIARRRRKRGVRPVYGTGWMAPSTGKYGGPNGNNGGYPMNNYNSNQQSGYQQNAGYYGNQHQDAGPYNQGFAPPPPAYGDQQAQPQQPQYTGSTFSPNDGYFGNHQQHQQASGVQSPPNTYQPNHVTHVK